MCLAFEKQAGALTWSPASGGVLALELEPRWDVAIRARLQSGKAKIGLLDIKVMGVLPVFPAGQPCRLDQRLLEVVSAVHCQTKLILEKIPGQLPLKEQDVSLLNRSLIKVHGKNLKLHRSKKQPWRGEDGPYSAQ